MRIYDLGILAFLDKFATHLVELAIHGAHGPGSQYDANESYRDMRSLESSVFMAFSAGFEFGMGVERSVSERSNKNETNKTYQLGDSNEKVNRYPRRRNP